MVLKKQLIGVPVLLLVFLEGAWGAPPVGLEWSAGFSLPQLADGHAAIGVGAPFFGGHNGVALLAGGSNFPDVPLLKGGKKRYRAEIYALPQGGTNWVRAGQLSAPCAEGMSATTPRGVVCVGGSVDGKPTSRVFLLTWDAVQGRAVETALPDFPCGVRLGAAAARDNRVFVAGGECTKELPGDVWTLDVDEPQAGWSPLPALPGVKGRMQPVAFVQNGDQKKTYLYAIGGYARRTAEGGDGSTNRPPALSAVEGRTPRGGVPSGDRSAELYALTDGYAYDLAQPAESGRWLPVSPALPKGFSGPAWPLIGAKCLAVGDQHALVFGGLDAAYFD
ncbi:MAG: hypothetical protein PHV28_06830, partial [Kiritimatiellae bacterium]|nr:hypothetical protein [Kiritimatiellia bacterium]